jgi:hypothetical protein
MNRYMDNMAAFAALPDELATPSHYAYEYAVKVCTYVDVVPAEL